MCQSLNLLAKITNCNVQRKVEREEYISIVYVFTSVNEHDSLAKVVLKMRELLLLSLCIFVFLLRQDHQAEGAQEEEGMAKCVSTCKDPGSE